LETEEEKLTPGELVFLNTSQSASMIKRIYSGKIGMVLHESYTDEYLVLITSIDTKLYLPITMLKRI
jgi:hypothetical protein